MKDFFKKSGSPTSAPPSAHKSAPVKNSHQTICLRCFIGRLDQAWFQMDDYVESVFSRFLTSLLRRSIVDEDYDVFYLAHAQTRQQAIPLNIRICDAGFVHMEEIKCRWLYEYDDNDGMDWLTMHTFSYPIFTF